MMEVMDIGAAVYDKRVEAAVLGYLLNYSGSDVDQILYHVKDPEVFYNPVHRLMYRAIQDLAADHKEIDALTVVDRMKQLDKITAEQEYQVYEVMSLSAHIVDIFDYVEILQRLYMHRRMHRIAGVLAKASGDTTVDPIEVLDNARRDFDQLIDSVAADMEQHIGDILVDVTEDVSRLSEGLNTLSGVPTGLASLDRITGGWGNTDLIVIAARPGMGKTAFVLGSALAAARAGHPVGIFSLEMSKIQLVKRMVSASSDGLHSNMLFKHGMRDKAGQSDKYWQQYHEVVRDLEQLPIYIDERIDGLYELQAKARRLKSQYNIEMLIIDYLQLVEITGDKKQRNREQEISTITRRLKQLAKELDLPILCLSQLSRQVETRGDKRPRLADLRESGAIEQDADLVCFLYRAEYYGIPELLDGSPSANMGEVEIAKHRNGGIGTVIVGFDGNFTRWYNPDDPGIRVEVMDDTNPF